MNKLSDELITELIRFGLNRQQAESQTAKKCFEFFQPKDETAFLEEASRQLKEQVQKAEAAVRTLKNDYSVTKARIRETLGEVSDTVTKIAKAQEEHGADMDEKAKSVLALYAGLIDIGAERCRDDEIVIQNAGYIVYAYLGGQARRDVQYCNISKEIKEEAKNARSQGKRW